MKHVLQELKNKAKLYHKKAEGYHSEGFQKYHHGVAEGIYIAIELIEKEINSDQIKN